MIDLGDFPASHTAVCIPFDSFAASTGAPSAVTNFAAGDVQVYKDGGTTQRSSSAGITVSTSFDSQTGLQMIVIDLSDNTDAGFYAAGHEYQVAVADITVDGQTLRFWAGTFSIERANGILALLKATGSIKVDVAKWNATTVATPATAGIPDVNVKNIDNDAASASGTVTFPGTVASATNITAATGITVATNNDKTGYSLSQTFPSNFSSLAIDTSGRVNAFLIGILTTVFTEGATGRIAAAFKQFFNIATPAATMDHGILVDTVTTATTATTLTNAPSDSSGVTTLLGKFTGITVLAQWLGLIAGKQTGNSTARTELRATGAGSGTYDETTDSQEAARDNMGTAQTGDAFALIGTAGAGLTALGDTRIANLDATISSRTKPADTQAAVTTVTNLTNAPTNGDLTTAMKASVNAEADTALADAGVTAVGQAHLDADVSTRASQTSVDDLPTNAELATALSAIVTTALTESYAADGAAPTLAQAIFLIQQRLTEFAISGTTITVKKINGSTTAATLTIDDATSPTSSTRTT